MFFNYGVIQNSVLTFRYLYELSYLAFEFKLKYITWNKNIYNNLKLTIISNSYIRILISDGTPLSMKFDVSSNLEYATMVFVYGFCNANANAKADE